MTQDEIIRMATEAGGFRGELPKGDAWMFFEDEYLERFAALVAAHEREKHLNLANEVAWSVALAEREACAKVCEDLIAKGYQLEGELDLCAAAIRARGNE